MAEDIFVLGRRVRLLQPEGGGFRTSLDSVMVAAACPARDGQRVLDLGCGVGGAGLCLLQRVGARASLTGVDIQADYIELAHRNAALNGREEGCSFLVDNIKNFRISNAKERFDHVLCNPPFLEAGTHTPSPDGGRATALANMVEDVSLIDWINCAFYNLKPGGGLTMIHRADHIDRMVQALGRRFGDVEIIPLYPRRAEAARRVILRARKDRKGAATLHPGLVLHMADGAYTEDAEAILRDGAGLFTIPGGAVGL